MSGQRGPQVHGEHLLAVVRVQLAQPLELEPQQAGPGTRAAQLRTVGKALVHILWPAAAAVVVLVRVRHMHEAAEGMAVAVL